jgi:phage-related minor tail protein
MADRIKGITVEIGGDTTGLSKALSGVNKEIRNTQSQLTDVSRLLKLDPANSELLSQKQKQMSISPEMLYCSIHAIVNYCLKSS